MTTSSESGLVRGGSRRIRSVIDPDSRFVGSYSTPNELQIEGQYEGTIDCSGLLVIAETADVNAQVTAGSVSVQGHLRGEIGCREKFEILPDGRVEGKIDAAVIVVHEGARMEGEIHMRSGSERGSERGGAAAQPRSRRTSDADSGMVTRTQSESSRSNGRTAPSYRESQMDTDGAVSQGKTPSAED
jgi:cytoskeletal protein CcmA (bactofilin family)